MIFTRLTMLLKGFCAVDRGVTPKWIHAIRRGGKWVVRINGKLMVMYAEPLKTDDIKRPACMHIAAYKRELVTSFKKLGLKCVVSVRARNLDNVNITLTLPGNGMSVWTMHRLLKRGFGSPYRHIPVRVVGA